eukprot:TRINITY_DN4696_c0_g1_i1.p1 TRINITY_DN4696_c0_g1~~TRINITY_DN4696_c0_g1_i1.p1  ORF type:complete len:273 (-),score=78.35 TRINITY_DN4696_c0_g1_i1:39-857(-)
MSDSFSSQHGRLSTSTRIILVLSGKGGVGKSLVSVQLALILASLGKKVGLLDVDLCGPSIPKLLNLEDAKVHQSTQGWVPVCATQVSPNLKAMSIGFLLESQDSAVIWRGPKKNAFIKQLVEEVCWGDIDFLVIDTPPGTSDEHISTTEYLRAFNPEGAVIVTTPQVVSLNDVRKEISFCNKIELPIIGLIENMSGFKCPTCEECTNIFSSKGGEILAEQCNVPFIGRIPLDPSISLCSERGASFGTEFPESSSLKPLYIFAKELIEKKKKE